MTITEKAAENILEGVFSVYNKKEHYINTNNNGILNDENVQYEKKKVLKDAIAYLADDVVTSLQHYPIDDISKVELETDIVVLKRKDFEFIKEIFQELITEKYD